MLGGKVKKFLAILVLGIGIVLTIPNLTFAGCNTVISASIEIEDEENVPLYACVNSDIFDNTGGYTLERAGTIIAAVGDNLVQIKNSGTILTTSDNPAINGNNSTNLTITNNSGGFIKSLKKAININSGTDAEIINAGEITTTTGAQAIRANGSGLKVTKSGTIKATTTEAIKIESNAINAIIKIGRAHF